MERRLLSQAPVVTCLEVPVPKRQRQGGALSSNSNLQPVVCLVTQQQPSSPPQAMCSGVRPLRRSLREQACLVTRQLNLNLLEACLGMQVPNSSNRNNRSSPRVSSEAPRPSSSSNHKVVVSLEVPQPSSPLPVLAACLERQQLSQALAGVFLAVPVRKRQHQGDCLVARQPKLQLLEEASLAVRQRAQIRCLGIKIQRVSLVLRRPPRPLQLYLVNPKLRNLLLLPRYSASLSSRNQPAPCLAQ